MLASLGFENRFWFRLLALCFSGGAVFFVYGFFYFITDKKHWPALIAVLYYATSTTFLRYADSLANQPVDDFFKWAILFFSIFSTQWISNKSLKIFFNVFIWFLSFILAISSYDSTFFIFFWLCTLSYFNNLDFNKKWYQQVFLRANVKKYLIWAAAPVSAFALQVAQNIWYLGLKDAILDFGGAFMFRSFETTGGINSMPLLIKNSVVALANFGYFLDLRARFALPVLVLILFLCIKNKIISFSQNLWHYFLFLTFSGLFMGFVLPGVGVFGYQGRQLAPASLIIISLATYRSIKLFREKKLNINYIILYMLLLMIWAVHFAAAGNYVWQWPNNAVSIQNINYWHKLNNVTSQNTIILTLKGLSEIEHGKFIPQYYIDRLVLSFDNIDNLLNYMNKISQDIGKTDFLVIVPDGNKKAVEIFIAENKKYAIEEADITNNNLVHLIINKNER